MAVGSSFPDKAKLLGKRKEKVGDLLRRTKNKLISRPRKHSTVGNKQIPWISRPTSISWARKFSDS
jgi:hypothetical protein